MSRSFISYWMCVFLFLITVFVSFQADALSLSAYLKKTQDQNLELKMEEAQVKYEEAKDYGLKIPPPMISWSQMNLNSGAVMSGFEINQSIPFPSKVLNDSDVRKWASQTQKQRYIEKKNELLALGKWMYFSVWESQERISLLQEKAQILKSHIQLSRSVARSDNFAAIHLLNAENDLDLLEVEILSEQQRFKAKGAELYAFVNENIPLKVEALQAPPAFLNPASPFA